VLALLRFGLTNDEIAERLGVSQRTAKYHVSEIIGKLGVPDRYTAALWEPDMHPPRAWALAPIGWLFRKLPGIPLSSGASSPPVVVASAGLLSTAVAGLGLFAVLLLRASSNAPADSGPARAEAVTPPALVAADGAAFIEPGPVNQDSAPAEDVVLADDPAATATPTAPSTETPIGRASLCAEPCETPASAIRCVAVDCDGYPAQPTATPTPPLDFAIGIDVDGDGTNDCGTGVPRAVGDGLPGPAAVEVTNTRCAAGEDAVVAVHVYLMNTGGIAYTKQSSKVLYFGFELLGAGKVHWPCPNFEYSTSAPNIEQAGGSTAGSSELASCASKQPQTSVGLLNEFALLCSQGGMLTLGTGTDATALTDEYSVEHQETGTETLTLTCGERAPLPPGSPETWITRRASLPA
jgi:hypothetical protein